MPITTKKKAGKVKTITAMKAWKNFGALIEGVRAKGHRYIVERSGKPVAAVVPVGHLGPDGGVAGDRSINARLAEGLRDIKRGRVLGPFDSATKAMNAIRAKTRR